MTRNVVTVNKQEYEGWLSRNEPMALEKLAAASNVSTKTLKKARKGEAPKRPGTRSLIARAVGLEEDILFPQKSSRRSA